MNEIKKESGCAGTQAPTSAVETSQHYFISSDVLRQAHDLAYDILNLSVDLKYRYFFEISSYEVRFSVYDPEIQKLIKKAGAYSWEAEKIDAVLDLMESELEAIRSGKVERREQCANESGTM